MTATVPQAWWSRLAQAPIVRCLLLSVALHAGVLLEFRLVRVAMQLWPAAIPEWVRKAILPTPTTKPAETAAKEEAEKEPLNDLSLMFVEVDPMSITDEQPKATPFYSTANTIAANVEPPDKESDKPKITGKQEELVRTFDNPRPQPVEPVQPKPESQAKTEEVTKTQETPQPPPPEPVKPQETVKTQVLGGPPVGDLALGNPNPAARVPTPQPEIKGQEAVKLPREQVRSNNPRRIAEAKARRGLLAGETMKQEGGVKHLDLVPSLDVKASPFGNYDAKLIYAVQQRWFSLLDESQYALERSGKVVLRFRLTSDGFVTDMKTVETSVGDRLAFVCETAVIEPAGDKGYGRWPVEMRKMVGAEFRELTFTFYYH
jgi:hypothetical protein